MDWLQISVRTSHEAMDIIAAIFTDLGANGVSMDDPAVVNKYIKAKLWDYTDIPLQKNTQVVVVNAWLAKDNALAQKLKMLAQKLEKLSKSINTAPCETITHDVKEEDWANNWKKYFHPTKIGKKIMVKPSWENYQKIADEIIIELDPGCAFGTGTHATTSMCVKFLEEYLQPGMKLFDVGTGSGILAICAAKLGLKDIQAADYDTVAVKVAKENITENNMDNRIKCFQSDLLQNFTGKADFISANIIADIIIRLFKQLPNKLADDGILLASGIIEDRIADVKQAAQSANMYVEKLSQKDSWAAMIFRYGKRN